MELECELVSNGINCGRFLPNDPRVERLSKTSAQWSLLLQVDSDDDAGMMWGDVGRLYFWIRKSDLEDANFSDVWMILQCA